MIHTADGNKLEYDSLSILTSVEENGEFMFAEFKEFSGHEESGNFHARTAKALA